MHRRRREQGGDRDAIRADHAIGKDDDIVATVHGCLGPLTKPPERLLHPSGALFDCVGDIERLGVEGILEVANTTDLLEILVGQDRLTHFEPLASRAAFKVE